MNIYDLMYAIGIFGMLSSVLYQLYVLTIKASKHDGGEGWQKKDFYIATILTFGAAMLWIINFSIFLRYPERTIFYNLSFLGNFFILLNVLFFVIQLFLLFGKNFESFYERYIPKKN